MVLGPIGSASQGGGVPVWLGIPVLIALVRDWIIKKRLATVSAQQSAKPNAAPNPDTHLKCPDCRELILKGVRVCKHCGFRLIPESNKSGDAYQQSANIREKTDRAVHGRAESNKSGDAYQQSANIREKTDRAVHGRAESNKPVQKSFAEKAREGRGHNKATSLDSVCPLCKKDVDRTSTECPHCGTQYLYGIKPKPK